ncbi:hypothetical protein SAMN05216339_103189 [Nitrosomonas eutropha]|uniref:Uncharacterized protein n=1 Tax=Nitrosomonas eutropha TaxID=916 RepID=A0A1I7GUV4_9PROT|nr:hypothetical protein [Nitrosomonas eutropha]SFU52237.1 hypothetical protein SAMN05216339_103189 [Nitrosomonas eutropha]
MEVGQGYQRWGGVSPPHVMRNIRTIMGTLQQNPDLDLAYPASLITADNFDIMINTLKPFAVAALAGLRC